MKTPIIFIHYGDSPYLKYTVEFAKKSNPDKQIVFLGDEENKYLENFGAHHVMISDYLSSPEIDKFHEVFKIIGPDGYKISGKDNGKSKDDTGVFWTKFVFLKMFVFYNYALKNGINKFWTFDTDNFIVTDLVPFESLFIDLDNTEQNLGNSMHGIINNLEVLKGYIEMINELFEDESFLDSVKESLLNAPKHHAYTEMWAYNEYKKRKTIKTIHLNGVFNNSTFDDKLCFPDGMETVACHFKGMPVIKKIYYDNLGLFYFKKEHEEVYLKVNVFDFSWLPSICMDQFYKLAVSLPNQNLQNKYNEVVFKETLDYKIMRLPNFFRNVVEYKLKKIFK